MELDNPILFWLVRCLVAEKYLVEKNVGVHGDHVHGDDLYGDDVHADHVQDEDLYGGEDALIIRTALLD